VPKEGQKSGASLAEGKLSNGPVTIHLVPRPVVAKVESERRDGEGVGSGHTDPAPVAEPNAPEGEVHEPPVETQKAQVCDPEEDEEFSPPPSSHQLVYSKEEREDVIVPPPVTDEVRRWVPSRAPTTSYLAAAGLLTGTMLYSVKAAVLLGAAHLAAPVVASALLYEGARRVVDHFSGEESELPDVVADVRRLAEENHCDAEGLAYGIMAVSGERRTPDLARSLKRNIAAWCRVNRKGWSEVVILDQTSRITTLSMSYTAVEDSRRSWWGNRGVFGGIVRATQTSEGQLGRLRTLPAN